MANIKISELTNGSTLDGSEYIPIVQNGATVKTTAQAIANLGGGGGGVVSVSPIKGFYESGIQSTKWRSTDDTVDLARISGTYEAVAGQYVEINATNQCLLRINNLLGSYYMFGIKCQIDPDFTPVNTDNWYQASCVLGQELDSQQRDFGIVIDKNGYFAIGWGTANITSSEVYALDGRVRTLFLVVDDVGIRLFIDGDLVLTVATTMSGQQLWALGIFYNGAGGNTRVNGKIYRCGYFSTVRLNLDYVVPLW